MKQFLLFFCILYCINHSDGLCNLDLSKSEGQVFEYAPANTIVLRLLYDEGNLGVDFTLSLDSTLDQYFILDLLSIKVKPGVNITRADQSGLIQGDVICNGDRSDLVTIIIKNINSVNPIQFQPTYNFDLPESTAVGDQVGYIQAVDEDVWSWFYDITSEDPPGYFSLINPNSNGNLRLVSPLNYQEYKEHQIVIRATSLGFDNEGNQMNEEATTTVTIVVQDEDNLPPVFGSCNHPSGDCVPPLYQASIAANNDNTITVNPPIQARDGDDGIDDPVTFSFADGTNSYDTYFEIDPSTAVITQIEQVPSDIYQFQIAIKAEEPSGKAAYTYLIIDVSLPDDNKPTFEQTSYSGYISQGDLDNNKLSYVTTDKEGRNPLRLVVSDADDPEAMFAYDVQAPFQVSSDGYVFYSAASSQYATQNIQVRAININARLDSQNRVSDSVEITIIGSNDAWLQSTPKLPHVIHQPEILKDPSGLVQQIILNKTLLNDVSAAGHFGVEILCRSKPLCLLDVTNSEGIVFEYAPANTIVLNLIYDGGNLGVDFSLTLDSALDQYFDLVGLSIVVKPGVNITRSSAGQSGLIQGDVICNDNNADTVTIIIQNINSINPIQFPSTYNFVLLESTAVGDQVGYIQAFDEDASSWLYEITSEDPPGYFELINPNTNGNLRLVSPLNYQEYKEHQIVVTATSLGFDNMGNPLNEEATTNVTIVVEDEDNLPPVFGSCIDLNSDCVPPLYQASIVPNEVNTITVNPPIQARDGDDGIDDSVTFSFADGTDSYDTYFEIDPSTAVITQIEQVPSDIYQFQIAIKAEEPSGKAAYTYLIIDVSLPDDNKPTFEQTSYSGYISQGDLDNRKLSYVTTDREGRNPLRLVVSDADDPDAMFAYDVQAPFQVSNDGYVFYSAASSQYATQNIQVRAINISARLDSPNRFSAPVDITIESYDG